MSGSVLHSKRILVGITGGIAAYKAAELVRLLVKINADPHVCMTPAATKFITPLTLETLSGNRVRTTIFDAGENSTIEHTEFGRTMDAAVVAPSTADFLGRLANGLADQLLLCTLIASEMPVLLCPSMNTHMWNNPLVQRNVTILKGIARYRWMAPEEGDLACRVQGIGRLPEPTRIVHHLTRMLSEHDLAGRKILITAGPTREWLDPVRFLSNPSTGQMGYALAQAAWERGAEVQLISGPSSLPSPEGVQVVEVGTTRDLLDAVSHSIQHMDALIMAAAPADYAPHKRHEHKMKKGSGSKTLELDRTPDVLGTVAQQANGTLLVGFAAETRDLQSSARSKAKSKGLDLIFANAVGSKDNQTGFAVDTNAGVLLDSDGNVVEQMDVQPKASVAHRILNHVATRLK